MPPRRMKNSPGKSPYQAAGILSPGSSQQAIQCGDSLCPHSQCSESLESLVDETRGVVTPHEIQQARTACVGAAGHESPLTSPVLTPVGTGTGQPIKRPRGRPRGSGRSKTTTPVSATKTQVESYEDTINCVINSLNITCDSREPINSQPSDPPNSALHIETPVVQTAELVRLKTFNVKEPKTTPVGTQLKASVPAVKHSDLESSSSVSKKESVLLEDTRRLTVRLQRLEFEVPYMTKTVPSNMSSSVNRPAVADTSHPHQTSHPGRRKQTARKSFPPSRKPKASHDAVSTSQAVHKNCYTSVFDAGNAAVTSERTSVTKTVACAGLKKAHKVPASETASRLTTKPAKADTSQQRDKVEQLIDQEITAKSISSSVSKTHHRNPAPKVTKPACEAVSRFRDDDIELEIGYDVYQDDFLNDLMGEETFVPDYEDYEDSNTEPAFPGSISRTGEVKQSGVLDTKPPDRTKHKAKRTDGSPVPDQKLTTRQCDTLSVKESKEPLQCDTNPTNQTKEDKTKQDMQQCDTSTKKDKQQEASQTAIDKKRGRERSWSSGSEEIPFQPVSSVKPTKQPETNQKKGTGKSAQSTTKEKTLNVTVPEWLIDIFKPKVTDCKIKKTSAAENTSSSEQSSVLQPGKTSAAQKPVERVRKTSLSKMKENTKKADTSVHKQIESSRNGKSHDASATRKPAHPKSSNSAKQPPRRSSTENSIFLKDVEIRSHSEGKKGKGKHKASKEKPKQGTDHVNSTGSIPPDSPATKQKRQMVKELSKKLMSQAKTDELGTDNSSASHSKSNHPSGTKDKSQVKHQKSSKGIGENKLKKASSSSKHKVSSVDVSTMGNGKDAANLSNRTTSRKSSSDSHKSDQSTSTEVGSHSSSGTHKSSRRSRSHKSTDSAQSDMMEALPEVAFHDVSQETLANYTAEDLEEGFCLAPSEMYEEERTTEGATEEEMEFKKCTDDDEIDETLEEFDEEELAEYEYVDNEEEYQENCDTTQDPSFEDLPQQPINSSAVSFDSLPTTTQTASGDNGRSDAVVGTTPTAARSMSKARTIAIQTSPERIIEPLEEVVAGVSSVGCGPDSPTGLVTRRETALQVRKDNQRSTQEGTIIKASAMPSSSIPASDSHSAVEHVSHRQAATHSDTSSHVDNSQPGDMPMQAAGKVESQAPERDSGRKVSLRRPWKSKFGSPFSQSSLEETPPRSVRQIIKRPHSSSLALEDVQPVKLSKTMELVTPERNTEHQNIISTPLNISIPGIRKKKITGLDRPSQAEPILNTCGAPAKPEENIGTDVDSTLTVESTGSSASSGQRTVQRKAATSTYNPHKREHSQVSLDLPAFAKKLKKSTPDDMLDCSLNQPIKDVSDEPNMTGIEGDNNALSNKSSIKTPIIIRTMNGSRKVTTQEPPKLNIAEPIQIPLDRVVNQSTPKSTETQQELTPTPKQLDTNQALQPGSSTSQSPRRQVQTSRTTHDDSRSPGREQGGPPDPRPKPKSRSPRREVQHRDSSTGAQRPVYGNQPLLNSAQRPLYGNQPLPSNAQRPVYGNQTLTSGEGQSQWRVQTGDGTMPVRNSREFSEQMRAQRNIRGRPEAQRLPGKFNRHWNKIPKNALIRPEEMKIPQNTAVIETVYKIQSSGSRGAWDMLGNLFSQLVNLLERDCYKEYMEHFAAALMGDKSGPLMEVSRNFQSFLQHLENSRDGVLNSREKQCLGTIALMVMTQCVAMNRGGAAYLLLFVTTQKNIMVMYPIAPRLPLSRIVVTLMHICLVAREPRQMIFVMEQVNWLEDRAKARNPAQVDCYRLEALREVVWKLLEASKDTRINDGVLDDIIPVIIAFFKQMVATSKRDSVEYKNYEAYVGYGHILGEMVKLANASRDVDLLVTIAKACREHPSFCKIKPVEVRGILRNFYRQALENDEFLYEACNLYKNGIRQGCYPKVKTYDHRTGGTMQLWTIMSEEEMHIGLECYLDMICLGWLNYGADRDFVEPRLAVQIAEAPHDSRTRRAYDTEVPVKKTEGIDKVMNVLKNRLNPPLVWSDYTEGVFDVSSDSLQEALEYKLQVLQKLNRLSSAKHDLLANVFSNRHKNAATDNKERLQFGDSPGDDHTQKQPGSSQQASDTQDSQESNQSEWKPVDTEFKVKEEAETNLPSTAKKIIKESKSEVAGSPSTSVLSAESGHRSNKSDTCSSSTHSASRQEDGHRNWSATRPTKNPQYEEALPSGNHDAMSMCSSQRSRDPYTPSVHGSLNNVSQETVDTAQSMDYTGTTTDVNMQVGSRLQPSPEMESYSQNIPGKAEVFPPPEAMHQPGWNPDRRVVVGNEDHFPLSERADSVGFSAPVIPGNLSRPAVEHYPQSYQPGPNSRSGGSLEPSRGVPRRSPLLGPPISHGPAYADPYQAPVPESPVLQVTALPSPHHGPMSQPLPPSPANLQPMHHVSPMGTQVGTPVGPPHVTRQTAPAYSAPQHSSRPPRYSGEGAVGRTLLPSPVQPSPHHDQSVPVVPGPSHGGHYMELPPPSLPPVLGPPTPTHGPMYHHQQVSAPEVATDEAFDDHHLFMETLKAVISRVTFHVKTGHIEHGDYTQAIDSMSNGFLRDFCHLKDPSNQLNDNMYEALMKYVDEVIANGKRMNR